MKTLRRCFYALASVALLTACNDTLDENSSGSKGHMDSDNKEGVYMAVDIQMPGANNGTRSATDTPSDNPGDGNDSNSDANPDTEVGWDYENTVNSVAIVLAEPGNNSFITYGLVYSNNITASGANNTYKSVAKFQKSDLAEYYGKHKDGNCLVNVFVFCNPTLDLLEELDKAGESKENKTRWIDATCEVTEGINGQPDLNTGIWVSNGFLMGNWEVVSRALPMDLDDWDHHRTAADAFNLSGTNHNSADDVDNSAEQGRGAIKVERAVARFDFKDGSGNNNTYNVIMASQPKPDSETDETEKVCMIQVELSRMCLVNMSNKFYYLRRVSSDGLDASNGLDASSKLCGKETPTGGATPYLVGPYYDTFHKDITNNFNSSPYFNFPFFNDKGILDADNNSRWYVSNIKDVLAHDTDNYEKEYHIWRYVTENVIPTPITNQQNAISTGIVFKGKMKATDALQNTTAETYPDGKILYEAIANTNADSPIIYSFDGILYAGWENIRKAVIREAVTITYNQADNSTEVIINRNHPLYLAVYGKDLTYEEQACGMGQFDYTYKVIGEKGETSQSGTYKDFPIHPNCADAAWDAWNKATDTDDKANKLKAMRSAVAKVGGITIYQPSNDDSEGWGYYCYYYYWNRHNDNGRPGVMGPMEFAVVRNNVYKLSVDKISRLGHPRISENDPEPPTPDTPDEKDDIYLSVSCRVLPWTVRINKIEF